jgi:uncharacterized membrane protein
MAGWPGSVNLSPLERGLSLALGAVAGTAALRRRPPAAILLGAAGALLIQRALTGHSFLYSALGVTGSEVGRTLSACSQITVQRPAGEVYGYLRDLGNLGDFSRLIERAEPLGGGMWRFGARLPLMGTIEWNVRPTADEQNRKLAWCAVEGAPLPSAVEVRLTERQGGTEIHVDAWLALPGPRLVAAALRGAERSRPLRRAGLTPSQVLQQELRRLRQVLEAGETATTRGQSSGRQRDTRRRRTQPATPPLPAGAEAPGRTFAPAGAPVRQRDEGGR